MCGSKPHRAVRHANLSFTPTDRVPDTGVVENPSIPPNEISPVQQQLILEALANKNVARPCSRCGEASHTLHNALTNLMLSGATPDMMFGGPTVPAALVFCNNCGLVSMHALGPLGLIHHPAFGYGAAVS